MTSTSSSPYMIIFDFKILFTSIKSFKNITRTGAQNVYTVNIPNFKLNNTIDSRKYYVSMIHQMYVMLSLILDEHNR